MFGTGGSLDSDVLTAKQWYTWNEYGYLKLKGFLSNVKVNRLGKVYDNLYTQQYIGYYTQQYQGMVTIVVN